MAAHYFIRGDRHTTLLIRAHAKELSGIIGEWQSMGQTIPITEQHPGVEGTTVRTHQDG